MNSLSDRKISLLASMIREKFGLDYPSERWDDLRRIFMRVSKELSPESCADQSIDRCLENGFSEKEQETLIDRLTIGETYFFREPATLDVVEREVLKPLSGKGSGLNGAVRVWSAACATGEEPYTLAMMGDRIGVDLEIVATDLDSRAIVKAREAVYRKWSFRTAQAKIMRDRYFRKIGENAFLLNPKIASKVSFAKLNLVGGLFPSSMSGFDLVFCRNVLMYFSRESVGSALGRIKGAMSRHGVFVSTPSEACLVMEYGDFYRKSVGGVLLFSPCAGGDSVTDSLLSGNHDRMNASSFSEGLGLCVDDHIPGDYSQEYPIASAFQGGENILQGFEESTASGVDYISGGVNTQRELFDDGEIPELYPPGGCKSDIFVGVDAPQETLDNARQEAESGNVDVARRLCHEVLDADPVNSEAYYLLGELCLKQDTPDEAVEFFRKALYSDSGFVMADVMLGNLYLDRRDLRSASIHFRSALRSLGDCKSDDLVEYSGGLTAGRLQEMVEKLASVCRGRHERGRFG